MRNSYSCKLGWGPGLGEMLILIEMRIDTIIAIHISMGNSHNFWYKFKLEIRALFAVITPRIQPRSSANFPGILSSRKRYSIEIKILKDENLISSKTDIATYCQDTNKEKATEERNRSKIPARNIFHAFRSESKC